jgi:hypothetical protein
MATNNKKQYILSFPVKTLHQTPSHGKIIATVQLQLYCTAVEMMNALPYVKFYILFHFRLSTLSNFSEAERLYTNFPRTSSWYKATGFIDASSSYGQNS